jgi:hypothetical protein
MLGLDLIKEMILNTSVKEYNKTSTAVYPLLPLEGG